MFYVLVFSIVKKPLKIILNNRIFYLYIYSSPLYKNRDHQ